MLIHYIWLGGDVPHRYKANVDICYKLNPGYQIMVWLDEDVDRLMKEEEEEIQKLYTNHKNLKYNLINKYNLVKYTILKKYGGVYTDLDIKWKKSFNQIANENGYPEHTDVVLTHSAYPKFMIRGELMRVLDDPFIITKQEVFRDCIEYRKEREGKERTDILKPESKEIHTIEPIGPFLLTEWIYNKNIRVGIINQEGYLDARGYYGEHEQMARWKDV